jgi:hypothetical protein
MPVFVHGIRLTTGMQLIPSSSVMSGLSNCRAFILIEDMLLVMRENEEKTNLSV